MIVERLVASKAPAKLTLAPAPASPLEAGPLAPPAGPRPDLAPPPADRAGRWEANHALARLRAETERVKVLVDFLARPICAHGGAEPDPDIVTAYNLAVEAALHGIRRASQSIPG